MFKTPRIFIYMSATTHPRCDISYTTSWNLLSKYFQITHYIQFLTIYIIHKNIDFTVHSSFNWICIQILHFVYVQIYSVVKSNFSMTHSLFKLHWLKTRFTTGYFIFSNKFFSSIITRFGTILSAAIWISDAWSAQLASGLLEDCGLYPPVTVCLSSIALNALVSDLFSIVACLCSKILPRIV